MVFSSEIFLFVFLPALLIVYYFPFFKDSNCERARRYKNTIFLLASLLFYWWGEPVFFLIMCFSILVNWAVGICIDQHREKRRIWVALACAYNLGILFVFKYLGFVTKNIALLAGCDNFTIDIALPIGISFFTFQMMSYVFDVANESAKCQKKLLNVALYITMFPQLIAGPIVRYETVANEINVRRENWIDFSEGVCRFIKGLAKKMLLANQLGVLVDMVFDNSIAGTSVAVAWLGAIAYSLQIFYDFSGYSDMAIGLGKMFGFHFLENFDFPYISKSITEFWRRWHISMGTWFRDYLYFPLGGSRVNSKCKLLRNLLIVWICTGIWHGANWTFILWGVMYFVLLSIEKFTGIHKKLPEGVAHLITILFIVIGWVIFRSESLEFAGKYIGLMFGLAGNPLINRDVLNLGSSFIVVLAFGILFSFPTEKKIGAWAESPVLLLRLLYCTILFVLLLMSIVFVVKGGYNPFIYFNF